MIRAAAALFVVALATPAGADVLPAPAPRLRNADSRDQAYARISVGEASSLVLSVETSPGTRIEYRAIRLPAGATLTPEPYPSPRVRVDWTPTEDDLGTFDAIVEATDGATLVRKEIHYVVVDNWSDAFMPAVGTSAFFPNASSEWGPVYGFPLQLVLAGWIRRNPASGASHGRVYLQVEPVVASKPRQKVGADVSFGFEVSFERMPRRRWLVPSWGVRLGDFVHGAAPGGNFWHLTPELGLYLWSDHGIMVTSAVGYVVPFSSFDVMRGPRASLGVTVAL